MTETNSLTITNAPDPQGLSFTPDDAMQAPKDEGRQAIEKAMADIEKAEGVKLGKDDEPLKEEKPAKETPKPDDKSIEQKVEDKPARERSEDGKFKGKESSEPAPSPVTEDKGEQESETVKRPSEGRDINTPPARFIARAKEEWANVPESVRGEVHRALENMEKGLNEYAQDREFRKELKPFEDMAKNANTSIPRVLAEYVEVYNQLRNDTAGAMQRLLATVGVTPEQYASYVLGQQQQDQQNPAAAGTRQLQQEVQALRHQIQEMHNMSRQEREQAAQTAANQHIEQTLFAEVRQQHPRFDELRSDIALFFNSDKLSSITDERSRLYEAVELAERVNPAPSFAASSTPISSAPTQKPINPAGAKSVRGAPTPGTVPKVSANLNGKEAIEAAMQQMGL